MALIVAQGFLTTNAIPNQLSDALDGMYKNTTAPQTFSTASMNGIAFGSISARFPVQNYNLVSFDPPRIDAGCSGIDMYLGSFAFINAEDLKKMMRAIAQGAVGFAFKMAVQTVCGPCQAIIDSISKTMHDLNALGKNTCKLSKAIMPSMNNGSGMRDKATEDNNIILATLGKVSGWAESMLARDPIDPRKSGALAGNTTLGIYARSEAASKFGGTGQSVPYPALATQVPELVMNLVGTTIVPTLTATNDPSQCDTQTTALGDSSTVCNQKARVIMPTIGFKEILNGPSAYTNPRPYQVCKTPLDSENGCQEVSDGTFAFQGTKPYVQEIMYGAGGSASLPGAGSIVATMQSGGIGALLPEQIAFLNAANGMPLLRIIYKTQHNPTAAQPIIDLAIEELSYNLAYTIVETAIGTLEAAVNSGGQEDFPDTLANRIAEKRLEAQRIGHRDPTQIMENLVRIDRVLAAVQASIPKYAWQASKR